MQNPLGEAAVLPSKFVRVFAKESVLRAELAGGGGYGDPFERDPALVIEDVRQGKVTLDHAREAYGVVIDGDTLTVDAQATRKRRGGPSDRGASEATTRSRERPAAARASPRGQKGKG